MVWARSEFYGYTDLTDCPYTVIFGHTPTWYISGKNKIWHNGKMIGIDCGVVSSKGQLGCLRLDDMKEFYV